MDWMKVVFLHTGWALRYDGTEFPEGGHLYLKTAVGVENENFKANDGWCYGYAPVSRAGESRGSGEIPKAGRTLGISKLGCPRWENEIDGITVVWTAKRPDVGPVIVGLYENATVLRYMPLMNPAIRPFIAKARARDCRLVPAAQRTFYVINRRKGFPGMGAAWFPGQHMQGAVAAFLAEAEAYLETVRTLTPVAPE